MACVHCVAWKYLQFRIFYATVKSFCLEIHTPIIQIAMSCGCDVIVEFQLFDILTLKKEKRLFSSLGNSVKTRSNSCLKLNLFYPKKLKLMAPSICKIPLKYILLWWSPSDGPYPVINWNVWSDIKKTLLSMKID